MSTTKSRLLSPNIPGTLKGLILSLCEANVQFTSSLCILGSIHILADGEEVSSFVLKESKQKSSPRNSEREKSFSNAHENTSPSEQSFARRRVNKAVASRAAAMDLDGEKVQNSRHPTTVIKRELASPSDDLDMERLNVRKRWRSENSPGSHGAGDEDRSPMTNSEHGLGVESRRTLPSHLPVGYPCNHCPMILNSGDELRAHISALHPDAEPTDQMIEQSPEPFSCGLCHMQFVSREWLQAHAQVCMLQCSQCSETFHSQQEYASHHLTAHNKVMLVCKHCNSIFKSRDGLNCHMNTAHNRSRIYPCGICPEGFYTRQAAYVHRRRMHPSQQLPSQAAAKVLNASPSSVTENDT